MRNKYIQLLIVVCAITFRLSAQNKSDSLVTDLANCNCNDSLQHIVDIPVTGGYKVLQTGRQMAVIDKTIIKGSCWDFVNAVFKQSGADQNKKVIFRSKKGGPYAKADMVQPGDWIYHVNHSYNNVEHSAIFVCWKDFDKRLAVTLSYAGMNRNQPAKYGTYSLKSIYSIFRATPPAETPKSIGNTGN